jgi:hypothetical protein
MYRVKHSIIPCLADFFGFLCTDFLTLYVIPLKELPFPGAEIVDVSQKSQWLLWTFGWIFCLLCGTRHLNNSSRPLWSPRVHGNVVPCNPFLVYFF